MGFLDPFSTYISFKVTAPNMGATELRFLDHSAHSFIERFVIRSQGTELERIDEYPVLAKMISDVFLSNE